MVCLPVYLISFRFVHLVISIFLWMSRINVSCELVSLCSFVFWQTMHLLLSRTRFPSNTIHRMRVRFTQCANEKHLLYPHAQSARILENEKICKHSQSVHLMNIRISTCSARRSRRMTEIFKSETAKWRVKKIMIMNCKQNKTKQKKHYTFILM